MSTEPSPIQPGGGDETILLVDDEKDPREITERVLKSKGYNVLAAADPAEALNMCMTCKQHDLKIHLVLTDLVMAGMDGINLSQRVASIFPNAKIIFMS